MNVQMDSTGFSMVGREIPRPALNRINLHVEKNYFALLLLSTTLGCKMTQKQ